jgi:hypothetical protein
VYLGNAVIERSIVTCCIDGAAIRWPTINSAPKIARNRATSSMSAPNAAGFFSASRTCLE